MEIGYISSLCAPFRLLTDALKNIWAEDYASEKFYISNPKSNNDYVVRLVE